MIAEGMSATIEFDHEALTITHRGVLGFLTVGLTGSQRIFLSEITSVQLREASAMINGYIKIGTRGSDRPDSILTAGSDPSAVFFRKHANQTFVAFKAAVERAIQAARTTATAAPSPAAAGSFADEIEKLVGLRDRGILSNAEFDAQKEALMRRYLA